MFTSYADFEIDVQGRDGDALPFSVRSPGGEARGRLRLPTSDPIYQQLAARLAAFDTDEDSLTRIGQILFKALFQGKVKDVYARSQGLLSLGQGLRIKLRTDRAETEVAALPWEFMCDPDQIGPFALLDAPILHYIPLPMKVQTTKASLPLRILLSGAQTQPQSDVGRELREVAAALSVLGEYARITVEPHLTPAGLQRRLREGFDVWHFVGHGGFTDDGTTGQLLLEDGGDVHAVSAPELGILLNRSGVRLVVLDTWDGARLATDPFRRLAPALIRAQVPAVVTMQFKVPEDVTRVFAKNFYQALAEGFPIDTCMTEGRKGVMNATGLDRADWGIPVVYTHAPDGILFDLPIPIAPTVRGTIVSTVSSSGAVAASVGVHGESGALLSAPSLLSIERHTQVPAPPRRQRNFLNRELEQHRLQAELQPGGGAWIYGQRGCGQSALLKQVAASPAARILPDGVPCVEGDTEPPHLDDILQRLFHRFYKTSVTARIDAGMAQTYLSNLQALFVLDRLPLSHSDLVRLTNDILSNSAVLVAADDEAPNTLLGLPLRGLPRPEAVKFCLAEAQLNDHPEVTALIDRLCVALDNLPLPLLLVARLIRAQVVTLQQLVAVLEERTGRSPQVFERAVGQTNAPSSTPSHEHNGHDPLTRAVEVPLQTLDADERRVLAAIVVGRPDVSLAQITEIALLPAPAVNEILQRLDHLGLITSGEDRYAITTSSLRHVLELLLQPSEERARAAAFFAAAVPLRAGDLSWLGRERGNIAEAIRALLAEGQASQAGTLAKTLQPAVVLRGLWSSWGDVIDWAATAAQQSGDRALEAWSLHEQGTRAGLLGDRASAASALRRALELRKKLRDQIGIAATRRNMIYLDLVAPAGTSWQDGLRRHWRPILAGAMVVLLSAVGGSIAVSGMSPTLVEVRPTTAATVTVRPVNDAPTFTKGPDQSVEEDAGPQAVAWARDISPGSAGEGSQSLTFEVTSSNSDLFAVLPTIDPAGKLAYTPARDRSGNATVGVTLHDNGGTADGGVDTSASQTFVITVRPVNDLPIAQDDVAAAAEDTSLDLQAAMLLGNDRDADGDPLAIAGVSAQSADGGTVARSGDTITYRPQPNFSGADTFTYTVNDGHGGAGQGTVTVTVTPASDRPAATDDTKATVEDTPISFPGAELTANDRDPDGDILAVTTVGQASDRGGAATLTGGTVTYTPPPNFSGVDGFTYTISDGNSSTTGTVAVTVSPVNDAPIAVDDLETTAEDKPLTIPAANLTRNDQDVDGDPLAVDSVSQPSAKGGQVTLSGGTVTYTPPGIGGLDDVGISFVGADSFTYQVCDTNKACARATVTVEVKQVERPAFSGLSTDPKTFIVSECGFGDNPMTVQGTVTSPSGIASVTLRYRYKNTDSQATKWREEIMKAGPNNIYSVTIDIGQNVKYTLFEYRLVATNNAGIQSMSKAQTDKISWVVVVC